MILSLNEIIKYVRTGIVWNNAHGKNIYEKAIKKTP